MHTGEAVKERTIVPTLRYRDVDAAIAWLSAAFGFATRAVVRAADGSVRYAELTFGDGMIMLGPVEDSPVGRLMTQPEQAGGAETQICYIVVDDPSVHRAKAVAAGAKIVLEIDEECSGRGYSCRDPEGHIWYFGTYAPRRREPQTAHARSLVGRLAESVARRLALSTGFLAMTFAVAVVVACALALADPRAVSASSGARSAEGVPGRVAEQVGSGRTTARELQELRGLLETERAARQNAEKAAHASAEKLVQGERDRTRLELQDQLARNRAVVEGAQRTLQETREQLAAAERAREELRVRLDGERTSRAEAERVGKEVGAQLAREHAVKEGLEHANRELRELLLRDRRQVLRWRRQVRNAAYLWQ
jgi:uncharacterized glyoxalase superfamily protein PhnB